MRTILGLTTASLTLTAFLGPLAMPTSPAGAAPSAVPPPVPTEAVRRAVSAEMGPVRAVRMIPIDGRYGPPARR